MASATQEVSLCLPKEWKLELGGNIATIGHPTTKDSGTVLVKETSSPDTVVIEISGRKGMVLATMDEINMQPSLGLNNNHLKKKTKVTVNAKILRKTNRKMTVMRAKMVVVMVPKTFLPPPGVGIPQYAEI